MKKMQARGKMQYVRMATDYVRKSTSTLSVWNRLTAFSDDRQALPLLLMDFYSTSIVNLDSEII